MSTTRRRRQIQALFGVGPEQLRDGEVWTTETFLRFGTRDPTTSTLLALQLDDRRERAQAIDELPLDWFFAPGL